MDLENKFYDAEFRKNLAKIGSIIGVVGVIIGIILVATGLSFGVGVCVFSVLLIFGGLFFYFKYKLYATVISQIVDKKEQDISKIAKKIGKSISKTTDIIKACLRECLLKNYTISGKTIWPVSKTVYVTKGIEYVVISCPHCGASFKAVKDEISTCPYCENPIQQK